jgi:hypothetical protein
MDEGRKRVLAIVAGILVARHLKTTDDLFDCRSSRLTLFISRESIKRMSKKDWNTVEVFYKRNEIGAEGRHAAWILSR